LRRLCSCGSMDFPFPASSDLGIIALFVRIITKWKELHTLRPDACPYSSELHICHALHAHDVTSPVSHLHTQLETKLDLCSTALAILSALLSCSPVLCGSSKALPTVSTCKGESGPLSAQPAKGLLELTEVQNNRTLQSSYFEALSRGIMLLSCDKSTAQWQRRANPNNNSSAHFLLLSKQPLVTLSVSQADPSPQFCFGHISG
jgi:hypothetical protein